MGRGPSIEGRKNAEDAKRAKVFTKLIREITIATRGGVPDPNGNPLRDPAPVEYALVKDKGAWKVSDSDVLWDQPC